MTQPDNEHPPQWAQALGEPSVCHVGAGLSATPLAVTSEVAPTGQRGLFREGDRLVIRGADCQFPDRCIKTNEPAVSWRPIALDFHDFAVTNRSYSFNVPLGERWTRKAAGRNWCSIAGPVGIVMVLVGIGVLMADHDWGVVAFIGGFIVAGAGHLRARLGDRALLEVDAVNDDLIWLRGAGRPFLNSLPALGDPEPTAQVQVVTTPAARTEPSDQETQFEQQVKYDSANWPKFVPLWLGAGGLIWVTGMTYLQLSSLDSGDTDFAIVWRPVALCYYVLGTKITVGLLVSGSLLFIAAAVYETIAAIGSLVRKVFKDQSQVEPRA